MGKITEQVGVIRDRIDWRGMMGKLFYKGNGLLVLYFLVLLGPVAYGAGVIQKNPELPSTLQSPKISAYVQEILPLVEKATGKSFNTAPRIRLADQQTILPLLNLEFKVQFRNLYPDYSEARVEFLSQEQSATIAPVLMGKYGLFDRNIYLLPDNIGPLFKVTHTPSEYLEPVLKILIAHELTHALQDQEINMRQMVKLTDPEELKAFLAIMEGHAVLVQELVGNAIGLDNAVIAKLPLFLAGNPNVSAEIPLNNTAKQYQQLYIDSKNFIGYYYRQGGNRQVWEVLSHPPRSLAALAIPKPNLTTGGRQ